MFGMNRYKVLKCFIKEKCNCRRAFLSGDRSYFVGFVISWLKCVQCPLLLTEVLWTVGPGFTLWVFRSITSWSACFASGRAAINLIYCKNPKNSDTRKNYCNYPKNWNSILLLQSNGSKRCRRNGKPYRPWSVWSGSTLFAQTCQSKNLGSLRWHSSQVSPTKSQAT